METGYQIPVTGSEGGRSKAAEPKPQQSITCGLSANRNLGSRNLGRPLPESFRNKRAESFRPETRCRRKAEALMSLPKHLGASL